MVESYQPLHTIYWRAVVGEWVLVITDQENVTKEPAAHGGMALHRVAFAVWEAACFKWALVGLALIDVELMIYKAEDLSLAQLHCQHAGCPYRTLGMLHCKAAAIWLQAIFSLFILCWCIMCSSVENLVFPKRRFELESRQGKHHLSRKHFCQVIWRGGMYM